MKTFVINAPRYSTFAWNFIRHRGCRRHPVDSRHWYAFCMRNNASNFFAMRSFFLLQLLYSYLNMFMFVNDVARSHLHLKRAPTHTHSNK